MSASMLAGRTGRSRAMSDVNGEHSPEDSNGTTKNEDAAPITAQVVRLKVMHLERDKFTPIGIFRAPWQSDREKETKLKDLRQPMKSFVRYNYGFCLEDKSYVSDDTTFQEYMQQCPSKTTDPNSNVNTSSKNNQVEYKVVYIRDQLKQLDPSSIVQGQFILKIIDKSSDKEETGSIHSSRLPKSSEPLTLAQLRPYISVAGNEGLSFEFCFEDDTIAPDSILLETYLGRTVRPKDAQADLQIISIYVKKVSRTKTEIMKGSYIIRFLKKSDKGEEGGSDTNEGSVQSHDLGPIDRLCLYHLRPHIRTMSANSRRHEFCMADGTSMSDNTRLETYLRTVMDATDTQADVPVFSVFFQSVASKPWFRGPSDAMKERASVDTKTNLSFGEGVKDSITGDSIRGKATDMTNMGISDAYLDSLAVEVPEEVTHPSSLDENQWDDVLQNCNVFYGWKFDLSTLTVRQAPRPAFKLRKGLNMPVPDAFETLPFPPSEISRLVSSSSRDRTHGGNESSNSSKTKSDHPDQQSTEPKGSQASKDGATKDKSKEDPKEGNKDPEKKKKKKKEDEEEDEDGDDEEDEDDGPKKEPPKSRVRKADGIPTFRVHDDSHVDVSVVTSRMQESMARNNFSASSYEVGVSGNIKGVDVGVSGGKSERKENSEGTVVTQTEMTMIGNFRFPRVQLLLRATDLEPTAELLTAVEDVKATKSLEKLRALHEDFGHLFCEEIVLGGCLQTTRVTRGNDKVTESAMKSQFKAEVGAAVSAPKIASLEVKYSKEKGKDENKSKSETHVSDNVVFEATGGNTVLVTQPAAWIASVLDHQYWRIIERGSLKPLANVLAECASPKVRGVRQWFVQAIPLSSRYHNVPASRSLTVRFRLMPQIPMQIPLFPDLTKSYYLGHQNKRPVHPIRIGLQQRRTEVRETYQKQLVADLNGIKGLTNLAGKILPFHPLTRLASGVGQMLPNGINTIDITRTYTEIKATEEVALFTPARAQAPVLLQYDDVLKNSMVTPAMHEESLWEMIVPHDDILKNNTQVMLRSLAGGSSVGRNRWLTVYRTAQGTFLPGITSNEEPSVWRLLRDNAMRPDAKDDFFQEGDLVRLTWSFADQTAGFRDFQLDTFGRRCYQRPVGVKTPTLYFKVPYPGFCNTTRTDSNDTTGQALVLDEEDVQLPYLTPLVVNGMGDEGILKAIVYNLHDISFRLDIIQNNGRGEQLDYMTDGLSQSQREIVEKELSQRTEKTSPAKNAIDTGVDVAGRALLGPRYDAVSGPAKYIMRGICGVLGL